MLLYVPWRMVGAKIRRAQRARDAQLEIIGFQKTPWILRLDEFPYLIARDAGRCTFVLSGSSMRMMHDLLLHRAAPLCGRTHKLPNVGTITARDIHCSPPVQHKSLALGRGAQHLSALMDSMSPG